MKLKKYMILVKMGKEQTTYFLDDYEDLCSFLITLKICKVEFWQVYRWFEGYHIYDLYMESKRAEYEKR